MLRVLNSGTGFEFRLTMAGSFSQQIYETHVAGVLEQRQYPG
jgi:hypothetical protein